MKAKLRPIRLDQITRPDPFQVPPPISRRDRARRVAPATEATMASEAADQAFWPPIASIFDFTLKFEESIFTIAPSGVAIIFTACMLFYYSRERTLVRNGLLLWLKLVSRHAVTQGSAPPKQGQINRDDINVDVRICSDID